MQKDQKCRVEYSQHVISKEAEMQYKVSRDH